MPCKNSPNVVNTLDEFDRKMREETFEVFLKRADATVKYIVVIVKRTAKKAHNLMMCSRYIRFANNSNETIIVSCQRRWRIEL